jgi:hypothetical protein
VKKQKEVGKNPATVKCLVSGVVLGIVLTVVSCQERKSKPETYFVSTSICDVQRILMHNSSSFTFLIKEPSSNKLYVLDYDLRGTFNKKYVFIADVPPEKEMWLNFKCRVANKEEEKKISAFRDYEELEIHIHSGADINGGGWRSGKWARGETIPIE